MQDLKSGAKTIGGIYLLLREAKALMGAVVVAVIAILVAASRWRWTSQMGTVEKIACQKDDVVTCNTTKYQRRCTTQHDQECTVHVKDFDRALQRLYPANAPVPTVGEQVRVYFDPKNKEGTATLAYLPTAEIAGVLGLVSVSLLVRVYVLMRVKSAVDKM